MNEIICPFLKIKTVFLTLFWVRNKIQWKVEIYGGSPAPTCA